MLIGPPLGKTRQIFVNVTAVRVKNVRAVAVNQNSIFVVFIVGVASDVRPLVTKKNALLGPGGQALSQHTTCKSCSDNEVIEHSSLRDTFEI